MIRYKSITEYIQACHDREETVTSVVKNLGRIIDAHRYMTEGPTGKRRDVCVSCKNEHAALVADVLKFVIADTLHMEAQQNYLFEIEMKEGDDATNEQA